MVAELSFLLRYPLHSSADVRRGLLNSHPYPISELIPIKMIRTVKKKVKARGGGGEPFTVFPTAKVADKFSTHHIAHPNMTSLHVQEQPKKPP
jgi:hypothetical protein